MYVDTADGECVDAHYGLGGGTSSTRELDIRVYIFFRIRPKDRIFTKIETFILFIVRFRFLNIHVEMKWEVRNSNTSIFM